MLAATTFVGRRLEIDALAARRVLAREGRTQAVVVSGEPGIGKTSLARHVADAAAAEGMLVSWAKPWELGGSAPYWPWVRLVREVLAQLASDERAAVETEAGPPLASLLGKAPSLASSGGDESAFALYHAVAVVLEGASRVRPLFLVFDDLHAADLPSLRLTAFLLGTLQRAPIFWLATRRSVESQAQREPLEALSAISRLAGEIALVGLDEAEIASLLCAHLGHEPQAGSAQALRQRTGGNPLFVDGLVRTARLDGSLDSLITAGGRLPSDLRMALEQRLDALGAEVTRVLEVGAFLRRDFDAVAVAEVLDVAPSVADAALTAAADAGVLTRSRDGIAFVHDLFVEALTARVAPAARPALHLKIAEAHEARLGLGGTVHPAELCRHFAAAGDLRGTRYALLAAREALDSGAYEPAAVLLRQAIDGGADDEDGALHLDLGRSLARSGQPTLARVAFDEAARRATVHGAVDVRVRATSGYAGTVEFGRVDPGTVTRLEEALAALGPELYEPRAKLCAQLVAHLHGAEPGSERLRELASTAVAAARRSGSAVTLADSLGAKFQACWSPTSQAERRAIVEELQALLRDLAQPSQRSAVHRHAFNLALEECDGVALRIALHEYEREAIATRQPEKAMGVAFRKAIVAQLSGDFEEVDRCAAELRVQGQRAGHSHSTYYAVGARLLGFAERDDRAALHDALSVIERQVQSVWGAARLPTAIRLQPMLARVFLGKLDDVRLEYEGWARDSFAVPDEWGTEQALAILARTCVALGDRERARLLITRLEPLAEHNAACGIVAPLGPAARALGLLSEMLGAQEAAAEWLRRATDRARTLNAPYWEAQAQIDLSACLAKLGRDESANEISERVRVEAEAHGWPTLAGRASVIASAKSGSSHAIQRRSPPAAQPATGSFRREGDVWLLRHGLSSARLRHSLGLQYLAMLLSRPGVEVHVFELSGTGVDTSGSDDELVDVQALGAYRERIRTLREELEDAEERCDLGRADKVRSELDALVDAVASATGLGGRSRKATGNLERARVAVTQAIRRAETRIARYLPELAHHVRNSIRTGIFCSYDPEPGAQIAWEE